MIGTTRPRGRARKWALVPRLVALEERTLLATLVVDKAGGTGVYTTIGAAVTIAMSGDTIQIHPATTTYTEQVKITTSLTIEGTGPGVVIQSPSTLTTDLGQASLVEIGGGATVNISSLTIEGPDPRPATSPVITGIYVVGGATANVTGVTIDKMRQQPLGGLQSGRGILVGSTGQNQVGHATITDCTLTDYQKSGIVTGGNGTTVTVTGTTITGAGPTSVIAQNGIVINTGTSATLTNNTITRNQFTGTNSGPDPTTAVQATGILIDGSAPTLPGGIVTVSNNMISGNDEGIASISNSFTVSLSSNTVEGNLVGIVLKDGPASVSSNTISGNNIGVAVIAVPTDSFGGPVTMDAEGTLDSNNIFNNGNGGVAFPGSGIRLLIAPNATTTALATAHFNRIVGNSVGLDNKTTSPTPVDATLNWWGSNTGPNTTGNDKTSGSINTSPWLVLSLSTSPTPIGPGGTASVTATVINDSNGATHSAAPFFPDGVPIAFSATGGTMTPASVPTQSGVASSSFTSATPGTASASVTLDNQALSTPITVQAIHVTPPPTPQQTTAGQSFSQSFAATGGEGGFVYAVSAGQLPPGLALDPRTGLVSGSPTTPGTYAFAIKATDLSAASVSAGLTIVVNSSVAINPNTPPQGTVGVPYADQLSATGGTGTLTFALAGGTTLPPGLSLSNAGLITGTPTTAGTFSFTVTATDQKGASAALPLSIVVVPAQVAAPVVENLQRFGFHAQPTTFVLTFSTALAPAPAADVANYRLNPISGHRLGPAIPIKRAIYDPTTETVTLETADRVYLFGRYRLVVNGSTATGVAGATGLLLDGTGNGQPGSDYVKDFGPSILAGPHRATIARTIAGAWHSRVGRAHSTTRAPRPVPHTLHSAGRGERIGATAAGQAHVRPGAEVVDAVLATRPSAH
jgi:hypothetical protein